MSQVSIDDSPEVPPSNFDDRIADPSTDMTASPTPAKRSTVSRSAAREKTSSDGDRIQKLLSDTGDFDFGTLISGVSTMNQPGIVAKKRSQSKLPTPISTVDQDTSQLPNDSVCAPTPFSTVSHFSGKLSLAQPDEAPEIVGPGPLASHQARVEHSTARAVHASACVNTSVGRARKPIRLNLRPMLNVMIAIICVSAAATTWFVLYRPDLVESVQGGFPIRLGSAASRSWLKQGLPDPRLTPGSKDPNGTRPEPLTAEQKAATMQAYGLDATDKHFQVVRLIPGGLGGTSDPQNLFPLTTYYAALKAKVDKALADQVHRGNISAEQAALDLKQNWIETIRSPVLSMFGFDDAYAARRTKELLKW